MKLFLALAALCAVALARVEKPSWMVMPGPDGKPQVAVLSGPSEAEPLLDPYNDVLFYLFTRTNPDSPQQMWVDNMVGTAFDPTKPTKMLMHGYNSYGLEGWPIDVKNMYLQQQDVNVISVDWGLVAQGPLYNLVQGRTRRVGEYMGEFMDALVTTLGADSTKFHCVGHSLGAHGCGVAGKGMASTLGRVTGLDAALPLYGANNTDETLSPADADYVDVIHTDGGSLGFMAPLGDSDFYPNGGNNQNGCGIIEPIGSCSHSRSHEYFLESIESFGFVSHECTSWEDYQNDLCNTNPIAIMGEPSTAGTTGNYYLKTNKNPPYAQG